MKAPYKLGQYFTRNIELQEKLYSFILNKPSRILEPSIGRGDLINYVSEKDDTIKFDMYEIDDTINILNKHISRDKVIFGDFLEQPIKTKYKTIIGNPPYKRIKGKGNLYIDFISRCYDLLEVGGNWARGKQPCPLERNQWTHLWERRKIWYIVFSTIRCRCKVRRYGCPSPLISLPIRWVVRRKCAAIIGMVSTCHPRNLRIITK